MIPKIIHYCWFGKKEKPQSVIDCINSWKEKCPDYIIKEWNEENFDVDVFLYTREAYVTKKYAYVSDVARLYALLSDGGIYLDTDVILLKEFDAFLKYKSFIGMETPFRVSTAVIGAEKGLNWISDFYGTYEKTHFIRKSGLLKTIPNTYTLTQFLHYRFPDDEKELNIFPIEYFSAKIFKTKEYRVTNETICIHQFDSSWLSPISKRQQIKYAIMRYFNSGRKN